ncbi:MAG TPA: glycosyltransferase family 4 protein [Bryobacteraceae bacterium]|nr:glycosyltransferase family 4 protein [Bryobacteraceae bacterium]
MNILFLDQYSEPGGAQLCLQDLIPEVLRRGWNPRLMVPGDGDLVTWAKKTGVRTDPLPLGSYTSGKKTAGDLLRFATDLPRMASAVRKVVRRDRVDMVYVNGPRVLPPVAGLSCPVVFHAHSHVARRVERGLIDWTLRGVAATVVTASEFVAGPYRRVVNPKRVHVIYNGVADLQSGARDFRRTPVRIGIIGRIAPQKGHADFLQAAKQVGGTAEFLIYGSPLFAHAAFEQELRTMARDLPVTFCGWTQDVGRALQDLEILAVPSGPDEAATRVIPEAFSAGTPVVAYRAGGIPEIVEHKRTGILTESPNAAALAKSLRGLMDDPATMERLSAAGRREWQRRFRVERFRTAICDLIESHARQRY